MTFAEWEQSVPAQIREDVVWKFKAYRLSLFLGDLAWHDASKLVKDKRTIGVADQLYRAAGAISADIEEGYSRLSGRDRARFYEYALGSAREARGWCYKGRYILGPDVTAHRIAVLTEIVKLLLTMVPDQRDCLLKEEGEPYSTSADPLLQNAPIP